MARVAAERADATDAGDREQVPELPRHAGIGERHRERHQARGRQGVSSPSREARGGCHERHGPRPHGRGRGPAERDEERREGEKDGGAPGRAEARAPDRDRDERADEHEVPSRDGDEVRDAAARERVVEPALGDRRHRPADAARKERPGVRGARVEAREHPLAKPQDRPGDAARGLDGEGADHAHGSRDPLGARGRAPVVVPVRREAPDAPDRRPPPERLLGEQPDLARGRALARGDGPAAPRARAAGHVAREPELPRGDGARGERPREGLLTGELRRAGEARGRERGEEHGDERQQPRPTPPPDGRERRRGGAGERRPRGEGEGGRREGEGGAHGSERGEQGPERVGERRARRRREALRHRRAPRASRTSSPLSPRPA